MKRAALLLILLIGMAWGPGAGAANDSIRTKDGKVYTGSILFHNDDFYYMSLGSSIKTVPIADIEKIDFEPASVKREPTSTVVKSEEAR